MCDQRTLDSPGGTDRAVFEVEAEGDFGGETQQGSDRMRVTGKDTDEAKTRT